MAVYLGNTRTKDSKGKRYLDVDSEVWDTARKAMEENQDFYDNDKNHYINQLMYSDYSVNADIIPIIPLPITRYMVIIKSSVYNKATMLETLGEEGEIDGYIKFNNFRLGIVRTIISASLHGVGFLMVTAGTPLKFSALDPEDIVYNYNFKRLIVRIDIEDVDTFRFKYAMYQEVDNGKYWRITNFIAGDWGSFNWKELGKTDTEEIISIEKISACPIIPMFKTANRVAYKSVFTYADLVLNLLLGFGLANVPQALLVKIWIENAQKNGNIDMADKLGALSDILDVLPLAKDEKAGTLDTGDLTSFANFFTIFEALLTQIAQMEGIPRGAMQEASPSRDSGTAKAVDNKSANIYRDFEIMELNEFEDNVFETINTLLNKDFKFKNINKSTSAIASNSDILEEGILAVTNGFEDMVVAVAKYQGLSKKDARAYLEKIRDSRKQYGDLLVGMAGQPMANGGGIGDSNKSEGVYKKDMKNADEKAKG